MCSPSTAAATSGRSVRGSVEQSCFFLRLEVRKAGRGCVLAQPVLVEEVAEPRSWRYPPPKVACPSDPLLWWPHPVSPWSPRCPFSPTLIPIKSFVLISITACHFPG